MELLDRAQLENLVANWRERMKMHEHRALTARLESTRVSERGVAAAMRYCANALEALTAREVGPSCDHDYAWVQETSLGGTQYHCEKCGRVKWEPKEAQPGPPKETR